MEKEILAPSPLFVFSSLNRGELNTIELTDGFHSPYNIKAVFNSEIVGYIIVEETPDPPSVSPAAGIYHEDTQITIEVPDGCRAYYAFDKMPTAEGTEYVRPITMPVYSHTFYAILVAANGMVSEPTVVEY